MPAGAKFFLLKSNIPSIYTWAERFGFDISGRKMFSVILFVGPGDTIGVLRNFLLTHSVLQWNVFHVHMDCYDSFILCVWEGTS